MSLLKFSWLRTKETKATLNKLSYGSFSNIFSFSEYIGIVEQLILPPDD